MQKKKSFIFVFIVASFLLISGCQKSTIQNSIDNSFYTLETLTEKAQNIYSTYDVYHINNSLKELAMILAKAVNTNPEVKEFIVAEIGKKFDDDYDAMVDLIAKSFIKSKTFEQALNEVMASDLRFSKANLAQLAGSVPYLNFAIPVNHEMWATYDQMTILLGKILFRFGMDNSMNLGL